MNLMIVYNPHDDLLDFKFNSRVYGLKPQELTTIPRPALQPMLAQVGQYGVTVVPQGLGPKEFDDLTKEAHKKWLVGMTEWAESQILSSRKRNKERIEAGLAPIESADTIAAREFLNKHSVLS